MIFHKGFLLYKYESRCRVENCKVNSLYPCFSSVREASFFFRSVAYFNHTSRWCDKGVSQSSVGPVPSKGVWGPHLTRNILGFIISAHITIHSCFRSLIHTYSLNKAGSEMKTRTIKRDDHCRLIQRDNEQTFKCRNVCRFCYVNELVRRETLML